VTRTAVVFPGQGSQVPGMRDAVADRCPDLLAACIAGVGEDPFLRVEDSTRFAQPAIFCASWAAWTALDLEPAAGAGHSLGEIAALAAAGAIHVEDALRLVVLRGRLMAGADADGSMLALLGGKIADARAVAAASGVTVANDNAPGQVVLSGSRADLVRAAGEAEARGLRATPLPVAGAFHSPAMAPAVDDFRAALDDVRIDAPRFPVFSCATARPFEDVRDELAAALTRPVLWRATVAAMLDAGIEAFVEPGPGAVLTRLEKRIRREREALVA
jgi:[acyl-carrier-protein] S-malonyltransferase